jgi:hypothetical protein
MIRSKTVALVAGVLFLSLLPDAHAQQTQPPHRVPGFPMRATEFETTVQLVLTRLRSLRPVGPVTTGDINKGILLYRDCTARIEADGVVTFAEMNYCNDVLRNFEREKMREIMMSSTPDEWAKWSQQFATANPHH